MKDFNNSRDGGSNSGGFGRRNSGPREMFKAKCDKCHRDCEISFRPTAGKPIFCDDCFRANKGSSGRLDYKGRDNRGSGDRKLYSATCETCGNSCQIPFEPRGGRAVYCSDCFSKQSGSRDGGSSSRRGGGDDYGRQFRELNEKLDRILKAVSTPVTAVDLYPEAKQKKEKAGKKLKTKKIATKKVVKKKPAKKSSVKKK